MQQEVVEHVEGDQSQTAVHVRDVDEADGGVRPAVAGQHSEGDRKVAASSKAQLQDIAKLYAKLVHVALV